MESLTRKRHRCPPSPSPSPSPAIPSPASTPVPPTSTATDAASIRIAAAADPDPDPDPVMVLLDAVEALIAGTSPSAERMATVGRRIRAVLHRAEVPPCDLEIVRYAR